MGRSYNTRRDGSIFDEKTIEAVWRKGTSESDYSSFRKDVCGASMQRNKYGKTELWGWGIDHKNPVSKGGTDELDSPQPLQWENNRHKGDNYPNWSCKIKIREFLLNNLQPFRRLNSASPSPHPAIPTFEDEENQFLGH